MATTLSITALLTFAAGAFSAYMILALPRALQVAKRTRKHVKAKRPVTTEDCPFEYLLNIYGKHHFAGFVRKLDPSLEATNPDKYNMVNEIMDGVHVCLILVDDITDRSPLRRGKPTAHTIFGPDETANRAYLTLTRVLNKTSKTHPQLLPFLLQCLEEIIEGQDLSLVWRRDGLAALSSGQEARERAYRQGAWLKTGALFKLVGQLVVEGHSWDDTMSKVGWYSQLQNDVKNHYSPDYALTKGSLSEDFRNGEFSYPIILALDKQPVVEALGSENETVLKRALEVVGSESVKGRCLREMRDVEREVGEWVVLWGRDERLQ
ncbi:MAG: hypothetical protein Q9195_007209 [Heterodermia aff. obscurata]